MKPLKENALQWGFSYLMSVLEEETVSEFEDWYNYYADDTNMPDGGYDLGPLPDSDDVREGFYEMMRRAEEQLDPKGDRDGLTSEEKEKFLKLLTAHFPDLRYENTEMNGGDTVEALCELYAELGGETIDEGAELTDEEVREEDRKLRIELGWLKPEEGK